MSPSSKGSFDGGDPMAGGSAVHRALLIWSYERGTLQYDIMCGLILAFIFFVPRSCFLKPNPNAQNDTHKTVAAVESGGAKAPARVSFSTP
jgi:hypothetical protein